jgi:hypothetical protein
MRDDLPTNVERRVREVLQPRDEQVQRVVKSALASEQHLRARRGLRLLALGTLAVTVVLGMLWWPKAPPQPALHIAGTASLVVVTSDDGKRWLVNTRCDSNVLGEYVIAFPQ